MLAGIEMTNKKNKAAQLRLVKPPKPFDVEAIAEEVIEHMRATHPDETEGYVADARQHLKESFAILPLRGSTLMRFWLDILSTEENGIRHIRPASELTQVIDILQERLKQNEEFFTALHADHRRPMRRTGKYSGILAE